MRTAKKLRSKGAKGQRIFIKNLYAEKIEPPRGQEHQENINPLSLVDSTAKNA
jgi:hypothetical protein